MTEGLKKHDFIAILALCLLVLVGFALTFGHWGNLIVDCGREAWLPTIIFNKDTVMYRDIFNLYPPLSYLVNGTLYKIFGNNLNVLYVAGLFNTFCLIVCTYLLSKRFLSTLLSFSVCFFAIFYTIYGNISETLGFIFPYSYAYLYALSSFLISLILFLKFTDEQNNKFLYLSFLFAGFSIANKFEFIFAFLIYFICLFCSKIKLKNILIALSFFLVFPILSYGYIIYQGLSLPDILNYIEFGKRFFQTPAYKSFSTHNPNVYFFGILFFIALNIGFIPLALYLKKSKKQNIALSIILSLIGIFTFNFFYKLNIISLCWLSLSSVLILLFLVIRRKFDKYSLSFILTILIFLAGALKINFCLAKNTYGNYLIPYFVLINIIFLVNYTKILTKKTFIQFLSIILISTSLITFLKKNTERFNNLNYAIKTEKGIIYTNKNFGENYEKLIKYINENTEGKILALQEGVMLNYFTDKPTDYMLYHLIKIHIEALGEDYIINRLKAFPPDYIVEFKMSEITPKINLFIKSNYIEVKNFSDIKVLKFNKSTK